VLRGSKACNVQDPVKCPYGCSCYTSLDLSSGTEEPGAIISMQELMEDTALLDVANGQVWMQGGLGEIPSTKCYANFCSYAFDMNTGVQIGDPVGASFAAHTYGQASSPGVNQLTFSQAPGFCGPTGSGTEFAFMEVNISTNALGTIACMPKGYKVISDPDMSNFNQNGTVVAQASPSWPGLPPTPGLNLLVRFFLTFLNPYPA
jgi:hypothetical protein